MRRRVRRIAVALALCPLVITTLVLLRLRYVDTAPAPGIATPRLSIELIESTPGLLHPTARSCTSARKLTLRAEGWLRLREATEASSAQPPVCFHLAGWGGLDSKCLVEFAGNKPTAYHTATFRSATASFYYRLRYGGLLYFSAQESEHSFVMVDRRWCDRLGGAAGLRLHFLGADVTAEE